MNLLQLAVLLKARDEYNKRYAKPTRKSPGSKISSNSVVFTKKQYTYLDCLLEELKKDDNKLYEFFKKIYDKSELLMQEFTNSVSRKKELLENKKAEKKDEIEKLLEIVPNHYYWYDTLLTFEVGDQGSKSLFSLSERITYYDHPEDVFNDLLTSIASEMRSIELKLKEFESQDFGVENSNKKIEVLNKRKKYTIFQKAKKQISENILKEQEYILKYEKLKKEQITLKKFEEICISNKEELIAFIIKFGEYISLEKEIRDLKKSFDFHSKKTKRQEFFDQALENVIKEDNMSKEDMIKIFLEMDKVEIRGRRGEYTITYNIHGKDVTNLTPLLEWFIQTIYEADEKFVERNINSIDISDQTETSKKRK